MWLKMENMGYIFILPCPACLIACVIAKQKILRTLFLSMFPCPLSPFRSPHYFLQTKPSKLEMRKGNSGQPDTSQFSDLSVKSLL